jgi:dienelactone hydrolase
MPALVKKTLKAAAIAYAISLPCAFVAGGTLFTRPVRTPLKSSAIHDAMDPEWSEGFRRGQAEVAIPISPRVRLLGSVFGSDSARCVIVLHESGGTRLDALGVAHALWKVGLGVVILDRRAHGSSEGEAQPLFLGESEALKAVVDWLVENDAVGTASIGVCGIGDAATSALLLAAEDSRIDAVAAVDPVVHARDYVSRTLRSELPLPRALFVPHGEVTVRAMALFSGVDGSLADASSSLPKVARPVFVLVTAGSGNREDAQAVIAKLAAARVEVGDAATLADGYDTIASFFERQF